MRCKRVASVLTILCFLVLFVAVGNICAADEPLWHGDWGASVEEVKAIIDIDPDYEDFDKIDDLKISELMYSKTKADYKESIIYTFFDDKLAKVFFSGEIENLQNTAKDHAEINDLISDLKQNISLMFHQPDSIAIENINSNENNLLETHALFKSQNSFVGLSTYFYTTQGTFLYYINAHDSLNDGNKDDVLSLNSLWNELEQNK